MSVILPVISAIGGILDKVIPDADKRAEAKIKLAQLEQAGEFRGLELSVQAIVMEAKSKDKWTSRARPAFLYVMYVFILFALPMGILSVWYPAEVQLAIVGVKAWLAAIPRELYALFGTGYLGYVKKRSDDKQVIMGQEPKKFLGIF